MSNIDRNVKGGLMVKAEKNVLFVTRYGRSGPILGSEKGGTDTVNDPLANGLVGAIRKVFTTGHKRVIQALPSFAVVPRRVSKLTAAARILAEKNAKENDRRRDRSRRATTQPHKIKKLIKRGMRYRHNAIGQFCDLVIARNAGVAY